jgi:membrane-associated phospholipid phosphatase
LSRVSKEDNTFRFLGSGLNEPADSDITVLSGKARSDGCTEMTRWTALGFALLAAGLVLGLVVGQEGLRVVEAQIMSAVMRPGWSGFDRIAWLASRLGDAFPGMVLVALVGAMVCAVRQRPDLALLIVVAATLRALGQPMKWMFGSPRPPIDLVAAIEQADGLGYPSGHAFGAALVYGALAVGLPQLVSDTSSKRMIQVLALAMALLIGLSRVRLGVHWPTDVLGGLAFGYGIVCLLQAARLHFRIREAKWVVSGFGSKRERP